MRTSQLRGAPQGTLEERITKVHEYLKRETKRITTLQQNIEAQKQELAQRQQDYARGDAELQQLLAQSVEETRKAAKELEQRACEQRTEPTTMEGLEALREDHMRLLEQAEAEGVGTEARAVIDSLNHLMTKRQRKGDALRWMEQPAASRGSRDCQVRQRGAQSTM